MTKTHKILIIGLMVGLVTGCSKNHNTFGAPELTAAYRLAKITALHGYVSAKAGDTKEEMLTRLEPLLVMPQGN